MPKPSVAPLIEPTIVPVPVASTRLDTLLDDRLEIAAKIDQLTAKRKAIDADILEIAVKKSGRPDGAIETDTFVIKAVQSSSSHIDKGALLKLGVKPSIIEKATKHTQYSFPRITKKKTVDVDD